MKTLSSVFLLLLAGILFMSHDGHKKAGSLRDYYFPVDSLYQGKVYHFVSNNVVPYHFYWRLQSEKINGRTFLHIYKYNHGTDKQIRLFGYMKEEITDSGAIVLEFITSESLVSDPMPYKENSDVRGRSFLWNFSPGRSVEYHTNGPDAIYENRRFTGKLYNDTVLGVQKRVIQFRDSVKYTNSSTPPGDQPYQLGAIAIFAHGIGFCEYRTYYSRNEDPEIYKLTEILDMNAWKELTN